MREAEMSEFQRWIEIDGGMKQESLKRLFHSIRTYSEKEDIWNELFPEEEFEPKNSAQDLKLRKLFSALKKIVEEYFVRQAIDRRYGARELLLLSELDFREINREFKYQYRKFSKSLNNQPNRDSTYFDLQHELAVLNQHHLIQTGRRVEDNSLRKVLETFNISWQLKKSLLDIAYLDYASRYEKKEIELDDVNFDRSNEDRAQYSTEWDPRLIGVYDAFRQWFYQGKGLNELFDQLKSHYQLMEKENSTTLLFILLNASIMNRKTDGTREHERLVFDVYKWGLESRLLFVDGYLPVKHYKNFIGCCFRLDSFEEAERYIIELAAFLRGEEKDAYEKFCSGILFFHLKQFSKVMKIYSFKFPDSHLEIQARLIVAQCMYELGEHSVDIERYLVSLRVFVRTQPSLTTMDKSGYGERIRLFIKLLKLDWQDQEAFHNLNKEIQAQKVLYSPGWLIEKTSI